MNSNYNLPKARNHKKVLPPDPLDYYESPSCRPSFKDELKELKPVLKKYLDENPGHHFAPALNRKLGWKQGRVALVAKTFWATFDCWEESVARAKNGQSKGRRVACVTLHPHLRPR